MVILKGYEHREGEFTLAGSNTPKNYNNYVLHYVSDERPEVKGLFCDKVKCSVSKFELIGVSSLDEALEHEVYLIADPTSQDKNGKITVAKLIVVGTPLQSDPIIPTSDVGTKKR